MSQQEMESRKRSRTSDDMDTTIPVHVSPGKHKAQAQHLQTPPSVEKSQTQQQQQQWIAASQADACLLWFARTAADEVKPRPTTGTIRVNKSADVCTVNINESVPKVFEKLVTEGFLSMPVLGRRGKYVGMIDYLDLVWAVVSRFGEKPPQTQQELGSFFSRADFQALMVADIMRPASQDPHIAVLQDFSLLHVVELLARLGVHRCPVVDKQMHIKGLVTQSQVISLLYQNLSTLSPLLNVRLGDISDLLNFNIQTIRQDELAIHGFKRLVDREISALAVVDGSTGHEAGKLVDTLSVRDLRGIGVRAENFVRLYDTVKNYKEATRKMFSIQTPQAPICCTMENTLSQVLQLFDDGNIHRIFVIKQDRPVAIVSQRDFLLIVLELCGLRGPTHFMRTRSSR